MQNAGLLSPGRDITVIDLNPFFEISTISPGITSLTNFPPNEGNAHDSEDTTKASGTSISKSDTGTGENVFIHQRFQLRRKKKLSNTY